MSSHHMKKIEKNSLFLGCFIYFLIIFEIKSKKSTFKWVQPYSETVSGTTVRSTTIIAVGNSDLPTEWPPFYGCPITGTLKNPYFL